MEMQNKKWFKFLTGAWVTLILNSKGLFDLFFWIVSKKTVTIFNMDFSFGLEDILMLIVSLLLLWVMKTFKKVIISINSAFKEMTDNLNHSHKINALTISYVNFYHENKSLNNADYISKLNHAGFSVEDLKEIGVTAEFINTNRDKLFPNSVMEKYREFKKSLDDFKEQKSKPNS